MPEDCVDVIKDIVKEQINLTTEINLKPCPFCGCDEINFESITLVLHSKHETYEEQLPYCQNCGAMAMEKWWNQRR